MNYQVSFLPRFLPLRLEGPSRRWNGGFAAIEFDRAEAQLDRLAQHAHPVKPRRVPAVDTSSIRSRRLRRIGFGQPQGEGKFALGWRGMGD
jgi:hypothetical protein